jgi:tRNA/rRNA methyltransferase
MCKTGTGEHSAPFAESEACSQFAPLRIVLVSPRNPLNIGAAARAMSNFGVTRLRLVNPYDLAFREARSAVRAGYILEQAQVFETLSEAVADCTLVAGTTAVGNRDLHLPLHRLEAAGDVLREHLAAGPAALLFGSEKFGLSNDDMSHCHWLLRIPTRDEHGSMNLGQAVAICLYELRREAQQAAVRFAPPPQATGEGFERLTQLLLDVLSRSGYVNERVSRSGELKLRRLIRRLGMPANDVETWLGMLRQILWKIKTEPRP